MISFQLTVKLQNKLAKDAILMSLKNASQHLFIEERPLYLKYFAKAYVIRVDFLNLWKFKFFQLNTRRDYCANFL